MRPEPWTASALPTVHHSDTLSALKSAGQSDVYTLPGFSADASFIVERVCVGGPSHSGSKALFFALNQPFRIGPADIEFSAIPINIWDSVCASYWEAFDASSMEPAAGAMLMQIQQGFQNDEALKELVKRNGQFNLFVVELTGLSWTVELIGSIPFDAIVNSVVLLRHEISSDTTDGETVLIFEALVCRDVKSKRRIPVPDAVIQVRNLADHGMQFGLAAHPCSSCGKHAAFAPS